MSTRNAAFVVDRGKNILLVDDDRDLLLALGTRLIHEGYHVTIAADAQTAMTTAIRTEPDLVLLDLGLPAGGGMLVLKRLKDIGWTSHIPVIVITARDASFERKALEAGAVDFFQKPVDNDELFATMTMAIAEKPLTS